MTRKIVFLLALLLTIVATLQANSNQAWDVDIPYEKYVLDNGLTLIVHEDHKAPIVAVNIWYHVGSKNEKLGKTGFAHLFEHLMFNGSENYNEDYFQTMERIGATDINGTTSEDRTNYFQNVPSSAVDIALWMESDRMGHLLGAVTQDKLDEQRGVVQNEKRQYENQPYHISYELITHNTFPKGHPYSWTVIGSMEDLEAASLDDAHQWFKTYYGAANAVIAIAGDITPQVAYDKVEKYFGDIPSGPPIARHKVWIAKRKGTHRQQVQDRVAQARFYRVWNIPELGSEDMDYLDLVSDVLAVGKTSRFYKRLVYDDQIATDVQAYIDAREIASLFQIEATAKPGDDLNKIEKAIAEELDKFIQNGPTEKEMQRVKSSYIARFIRGIERIGGFGGKSDILASNQVIGGNPDYYKTTLQRIKNATVQDLHRAAKKWLSDGDYILELTPFPEYITKESDVDRSKLPEETTPPDASFPKIQRASLSNGLKLVLAERHSVPIVNFSLMVDAGYATDQYAVPGTARLTGDMLDEGTKNRTALQISEELSMLGATLQTGSNLDITNVNFSALKSNLAPSLEIFTDIILNPSFPEADFKRLQKQTLARIQREKVTPIQMALRVFPGLLYGKDHAYGLPLTGSGTEESVKQLTREDLVAFHQTWFKPNNSTLVIVGDITLDKISPMLEKLFKKWKAGDVPKKNISEVAHKKEPELYILDRPGSQQSIIFAGHLAPPRANPKEEAIVTMNNILGGDFTSRINMNIREDKHWSYGAFSLIGGTCAQRPYLIYTPVQSDKTKESIQEIQKELKAIIDEKPPTEEEFIKTQNNQILQLPGSWETINDVRGSISEIVRYGLPDDYFDLYPAKIRNMKLEEVIDAAKSTIHPDQMVWVVVGDRSIIKPGLKELGIENVRLMDVDGNVLE